jgi:hypothetical protein
MNVKMTQAWGWLVAGVLAAGLNASYHDGGLRWAHQVAEQISYQVEHRSAAVLDLASGHADRFVSEVRLLTTRQETASCPWSTAWARVQTRVARTQVARTQVARTQAGFDRFKAMSDRQEAQLARFEANRARIEAQMARIRLQIDPQIAHLRMTTATFGPVELKTVPVACSRVRVNVPRVPMIRIPAPAIDIESGSGPI